MSELLEFPAGTVKIHDGGNWAMYVNHVLSRTYMAYSLPGGTKVVTLPGVRSAQTDMARLGAYVRQRQRTACGECP